MAGGQRAGKSLRLGHFATFWDIPPSPGAWASPGWGAGRRDTVGTWPPVVMSCDFSLPAGVGVRQRGSVSGEAGLASPAMPPRPFMVREPHHERMGGRHERAVNRTSDGGAPRTGGESDVGRGGSRTAPTWLWWGRASPARCASRPLALCEGGVGVPPFTQCKGS